MISSSRFVLSIGQMTYTVVFPVELDPQRESTDLVCLSRNISVLMTNLVVWLVTIIIDIGFYYAAQVDLKLKTLLPQLLRARIMGMCPHVGIIII